MNNSLNTTKTLGRESMGVKTVIWGSKLKRRKVWRWLMLSIEDARNWLRTCFLSLETLLSESTVKSCQSSQKLRRASIGGRWQTWRRHPLSIQGLSWSKISSTGQRTMQSCYQMSTLNQRLLTTLSESTTQSRRKLTFQRNQTMCFNALPSRCFLWLSSRELISTQSDGLKPTKTCKKEVTGTLMVS